MIIIRKIVFKLLKGICCLIIMVCTLYLITGISEDKENENTEETSEQPVTDNLIGGAPVPPMPEMGNPFSGAPMPEMGNPFGGAPMPPMPEMNNQFGGTPVSSAVPTGMPFEEGPAPYFIRMRTGERINIDKA